MYCICDNISRFLPFERGGGAGAADSWSTHFTVRFCSVLIIMADAEDMSGMDFRRNSGCLL